MYKAVHRLSGEEILTLSSAWRGRVDELRTLDRADLLLCQGCRQAVRLKSGPRKRPHFAHKHLQGCSYGGESPQVLEARAVLYDWLAGCYPGRVDAEWRAQGLDLPRGVDCVVQTGERPVAFWILDASLKLEAREQLQKAFAAGGLPVTWVLLSGLLRPDPNHPAWLLLSPTERFCLRATPYDGIGRENRLSEQDFGGSLYYLDAGARTMTVCRSLERVHAPNVFSGRCSAGGLEQLALDARGDFVLPGEERELAASQAARQRQAERVRRWLEPHPHPQGEPVVRTAWGTQKAPGAAPGIEMVTCVYCGQLTGDWWSAWLEGEKRVGKCRGCLEKGLG